MGLVGFWGCSDQARLRSLLNSREIADDSYATLSGDNWALRYPSGSSPTASGLGIYEAGQQIGVMWGRAFSGFDELTTNIDVQHLLNPDVHSLPWGRWAAAAITDHGRRLILARDSDSLCYEGIST